MLVRSVDAEHPCGRRSENGMEGCRDNAKVNELMEGERFVEVKKCSEVTE